MLRVEHRAGIAAPVETVWDLIADLESWPRWHPLTVRAQGGLALGAPIEVVEKLGEAERAVTFRVHDWTPYEHLHLIQPRGLFGARSIRYLEVEKVGPANTIVAVGEAFDGYFAKQALRREHRFLKAGFEGAALSLKAEAERA